jgi:type II secretory pathway pseudopilin PulG
MNGSILPDGAASARRVSRVSLAVRPRGGFTLIEMLVSLTITIMMILAVVTLFQVMTDSVSGSRALLETADRLRACRNRLQGATATMNPPLRPESDEGYFEIGEGVNNDANNDAMIGAGNSLFGDIDDYVAFTTRSRGEPFVGMLGGVAIESQTAEVIYFLAPSLNGLGQQNGTIMDATQSPPTRLFTLYRRCLLIAPNATTVALTDDVSQRTQGGSQIANTLGDVTKPENRFNHNPGGAGSFPFRMTLPFVPLAGGRLGDDVLLTNVLAFDVQAWDPGAPVFVVNPPPPSLVINPPSVTGTTVALEPRDAGYSSQGLINSVIGASYPTPPGAASTSSPSSFGAYVDLGYAQSYAPPAAKTPPYITPIFNSVPSTKSGWVAGTPYLFDTWSLHYENDGLPEPTTATTHDLGTNGLDDDGNGIVDDLLEYDTLPPYSAKLRGVRITVRVYEPSSQQVREITVVQDFLAE